MAWSPDRQQTTPDSLIGFWALGVYCSSGKYEGGVGMAQTTTLSHRLECAIHSQYLESLEISAEEYRKLQEMLEQGLTEEQGIAAIRQWLDCHEPIQQQPE